MGKSLVIVESPAKAKTINKYLGNQYVVKSSIGHIRDLPTSGSASATKEPAKAAGKKSKAVAEAPAVSPKEKARRQLVARMGVDPEHGWKAHYEILPGKEKVIEELRRLAKDADTIYLATDLDREGEAIAWHLREAIGGDDARYKRVVFNEITKKAIQDAFAQPGDLDIDRVNAQQARRFLDRVVGYMVSPLLWQKIARGLSAGRVQSVAVKLIAEREREIRAFNPQEYWELHADLSGQGNAKVRFEVVREGGEAFKPVTEAQAMAAVTKLKASSYSVTKREDKPTSSKPSAPYITSTLQQAASNRLGFGVKKTMMMAQRLYEAGYITYMRTDSTNLSVDALDMARGYIDTQFGAAYLPAQPNLYSSKEGAQEAHEAIRPSDVNTAPTQLSGMERDAERLYELIWRQFLACQMTPAQYLSTTITVMASGFELRAKGRILKFDGYTRIQPQQSKPGEDEVLPDMGQGEALTLLKLDPTQHFTKPPARYSEASLVKEMEKRGIGRPSTYAAIISTIQDRGYVTLHNRRFYSEKMGDIVTERLSESFANLMDYGFTAGMEENLDDIAQGERNWKNVLDEFYGDFKQKLESAEDSDHGMRANQPTPTDIPCPECGRHMMVRTASTGVFLGCSGYSLPPKERCKATINLVPGDEIAADDEGESESRLLLTKHRCPICSTAMDAYLVDEKRKLHICGNNPDCPGYEVEQGSYRIKGYEGPSLECDKCGSQMQLKTGRFGKFFGCTNPECKNTRKLLRNGEAAPPKMDAVKMPELKCEKVDDTYVLRDGASGLFLAASQFPKNRETRAPLVLELIPHKAEIDPKYHFLLGAPAKDPDGRPAVIRYSRKTKEQYVQTEVEGKPTGWRAFFDGKSWKVEDKR
ncbi:type I DNA topoisomerase [Pseudomonas typographi]|uniref:DNA topoisomerase 1 n=1 Tax=Pseudomonas typographi TaxID=2715964 RepID=A0ABR7Z4E8_9PSED|nr:type I DNA topoisomerase [Pseudomonas typographi]MBD1588102.1 type I DNA topoisomerase [Pseudomonas typographi]MBD1600364.1 type I DNA topoisomerase [Pseudomonas typographi]